MKTKLAVVFVAALLAGCGRETEDPKSLMALTKNNIARAKRYHELVNDNKMTQAALQSYLALWIKDCSTQGYEVRMGQDGDPACLVKEAPPAPQPQPPQSQPPASAPKK